MLCVILGGRGFLGRHVGKAMAAAGYEVWSVDSAPGAPDNGLPWAAGEVACAYEDVASWLPLLCGPCGGNWAGWQGHGGKAHRGAQ